MGKEADSGVLQAGTYYMSGSEAVAEGAVAAGCRYYGGYPITPSSGIMELIASRFREVGGVFMQMEDEIASICSVIGASWAGAKAMTATSGPGLSLMMEALGYAAFTEAPIVIVDIQRAGPATGQATHTASGDIMQVKWGSHGDYQVVAYSPWSVQEMFDMTVQAFNMAERFRVPAFVMGSETMVHLKEQIRVPREIPTIERRKKPGAAPFDTEEPDGVPPMPVFGEGEQLLVTGSTHDGYGFRKSDDPAVHERLVERLNLKVLHRRDDIVEVESHHMEEHDLDCVVVAYGFTARAALFAVERLRESGRRVGLLRLKTLWPFADKEVEMAGKRTRKIFVPEMNMGQVSIMVGRYADCDVITCNQVNGRTLSPLTLEDELRKVI